MSLFLFDVSRFAVFLLYSVSCILVFSALFHRSPFIFHVCQIVSQYTTRTPKNPTLFQRLNVSLTEPRIQGILKPNPEHSACLTFCILHFAFYIWTLAKIG